MHSSGCCSTAFLFFGFLFVVKLCAIFCFFFFTIAISGGDGSPHIGQSQEVMHMIAANTNLSVQRIWLPASTAFHSGSPLSGIIMIRLVELGILP
jgi:hypothetical protein